MRALLWFLTTIIGTLLLAAALAWPAYLLLHPLQPAWWFDKIATRLWQLLMLAAIALVVRHLRLTTRADWGYDAPRPRWLRQFGVGLLTGLASMLPVTIAMLALGLRTLRPELNAGAAVGALAAGVGSGLVVGFLEETFFRGLMQGAVVRELRRPLAAIVLVAGVYAAVHFLASERIPDAQLGWHSGFRLLGTALGNFAAPGAISDAFLSLAAIGLLLGLVSWWTGSIALAVGLHAGWVCVLRIAIGLTTANPAAPLAWLINRGNGYVGWLVTGWTLLLIALLVVTRGRWRHWRRPF